MAVPAHQPERHFGYVEIKDTFLAENGGCGKPAVAVVPIVTAGEAGVWWLCHDHATKMGREVPETVPRRIIRTCQVEASGSPCGAIASHVAIYGVRSPGGNPELAASSVCARHAGREGA
jgi:hypothetical protein